MTDQIKAYIDLMVTERIKYIDLFTLIAVKLGYELPVCERDAYKLTDTLYVQYYEPDDSYKFWETCYEDTVCYFNYEVDDMWFCICYRDDPNPDAGIYRFSVMRKGGNNRYTIEYLENYEQDDYYPTPNYTYEASRIFGIGDRTARSEDCKNFMEKFPILFPQLFPPLPDYFGNIFRIIDPNIVGIQYVDIQLESI